MKSLWSVGWFLCLGFVLSPIEAACDVRTQMVPMRDGVLLSTAVVLPEGPGPFPVILVRTPYNKEALTTGKLGAGKRGYALVAQDTRGRFASEGDNLPFDRDREDGEDTIKWVASQSWSNGRIGSWGGSAAAITQYQLASSGTDLLACQHMVVGTADLYEGIYSGNIFRKALVEDWLRGAKFSPEALRLWTDHPFPDEYWKRRDAARRYDQVNSPAVHVGGYWDIFAQQTIDAFNGYQGQGGSKAKGRQKLVFGPWTHGVLRKKAGDLTFRDGDRPPGDVHDLWRWFDHWLKGEDNGIDRAPAVTYYVIGDVEDLSAPGNEWRTADAWPPFPVEPATFYLGTGGGSRPALPGAMRFLSTSFMIRRIPCRRWEDLS